MFDYKQKTDFDLGKIVRIENVMEAFITKYGSA